MLIYFTFKLESISLSLQLLWNLLKENNEKDC